MHAPCLADAMDAFNLVLPCLDAVSLVVVAFASRPARRAAREELEHRLGCSCYLALPCVDGTDRHSAAKRLDYDPDCESTSEAPLRWPDASRLRAFRCSSYIVASLLLHGETLASDPLMVPMPCFLGGGMRASYLASCSCCGPRVFARPPYPTAPASLPRI